MAQSKSKREKLVIKSIRKMFSSDQIICPLVMSSPLLQHKLTSLGPWLCMIRGRDEMGQGSGDLLSLLPPIHGR